MLSLEQCRKILSEDKLTDSKIAEIRDYLYSLIKEIVRKNIEEYEENVTKTIRSKQK